MWNPFAKASAKDMESVHRPVEGRLLPLEEVPDPVFAKRTMGHGFAVEPTGGTFRAPVAGELILLAKTLHAYAIRTDAGAEVLVHVGIDTVTLRGKGFAALAATGDRVEVGDPILTCDLDAVGQQVPSLITPVVLTNGKAFTLSEPDLTAGPDAPVATLAKV
ncbi:PTS sugar transporter subunit IIA [Propioniciclava coleopterorum]|nr:PTS glucose transporter subunit IIA [Propioniciclava coleopterorum]